MGYRFPVDGVSVDLDPDLPIDILPTAHRFHLVPSIPDLLMTVAKPIGLRLITTCTHQQSSNQ
jgi:hypothetical protein